MLQAKIQFLTGACVVALTTWASAKTVDLTTAGSSGTANGGFFQQINPQSTGTGVIDPFLRIQANGTEQGFNNNVDVFTLDDVAKGGQTFNHDIQLSSVPIVVNPTGAPAGSYYQFLLDINEPNGASQALLSLHELEIWLKDSPITSLSDPGVYSDLTGSGAVLSWDLDSGPPNSDGDSVIELNYNLNAGSGAGDMFAYIPVSALGTDGSKYVYLYSAFGNPNASGDGFEEWSVLTATPIPLPAAAWMGMALLGGTGAVGFIRRRMAGL